MPGTVTRTGFKFDQVATNGYGQFAKAFGRRAHGGAEEGRRGWRHGQVNEAEVTGGHHAGQGGGGRRGQGEAGQAPAGQAPLPPPPPPPTILALIASAGAVPPLPAWLCQARSCLVVAPLGLALSHAIPDGHGGGGGHVPAAHDVSPPPPPGPTTPPQCSSLHPTPPHSLPASASR